MDDSQDLDYKSSPRMKEGTATQPSDLVAEPEDDGEETYQFKKRVKKFNMGGGTTDLSGPLSEKRRMGLYVPG